LMRRALVPLLALTIATAGCSNMNNTQQRTLSGGAMGAAGGAVITAVTGGCVWCGAVIGGAVGAGAGYVYDQVKKGNM
jgi:osmotically inducible lipoprotein OsmB